jgi:hypothetical protein
MTTPLSFKQFANLFVKAQGEVFEKTKYLFKDKESHNTMARGYVKEIKIKNATYVLHYDHGQFGADYECLIHLGRIQVSNKQFDDMHIDGPMTCYLPSIWIDGEVDENPNAQADLKYFKSLGLKSKLLGFGEYILVDQNDEEIKKDQKEWESIIFNAPSMSKANLEAWWMDGMVIDDESVLLSFESIKSIAQMKANMPSILENICDHIELQLRENLATLESHYLKQDYVSKVESAKNDLKCRLDKLRIEQDNQVNN